MRRWMRAVGMTVGTLVSLGPAPAAAQTPSTGWTVPRTPDGQPDLQGVWANNSVTPLERPEAWTGKTTLTDEDLAELKAASAAVIASGLDAQFGDQLVLAALAGLSDADSYDTTGNYNQFWLADRNFDHNRTSLVVDPADGKIPVRTPDARRAGRGVPPPTIAPKADSWADRPLSERCLTFGVPNLLAGYNSYYQIIQGRDHVVILLEMIHDARIIPIDGPSHVNDQIRQLHGDSRGHWDGDTLVVETTNYSGLGVFWSAGEGFRLTERFTRVGPDTLHYEMTFDDQTTWTRPWTVLLPLKHTAEPMFEYACHEGNIGMEGILSGYRAEERMATERD
ncbi:MAG: hypothetical protein O3A25_19385 [Acidobacteria bacterium]|nr:hypothetical protein [Acidobacteriota bacterium]